MNELIPTHISRLTLSRSALRQNVSALRHLVGEKTLCCVVKANAYGHDCRLIVPELVSLGMNTFAVSHIEEAAWIRKQFPDVRILALCDPLESICSEALSLHVEPVLNDAKDVTCFRQHSQAFFDQMLQVHFKSDTGMGRMGIAPKETISLMESCRLPKSYRIGLMTHFASAENPRDPLTQHQRQTFLELITEIRSRHPNCEIHGANSAATLSGLVTDVSQLFRVGIALYGGIQHESLRSVMSWVSTLRHERRIPKGQTVGYLHQWKAKRESRIGIVPVGYRLGYRLGLSNKVKVRLSSCVVPVIGRISMDLTALDVTDVPVSDKDLLGSEVTLMSADANGSEDEPSVFALAKQTGTITYEIFCGIHTGIQRQWVEA